MGLLIKRHKARTPQQVMLRFWFAIGLLTVMGLFVLFNGITDKSGQKQAIRMNTRIDEKLDSAVRVRFPGATITAAFEPRLETIEDRENRRDVRNTLEEIAWENNPDNKMWEEIYRNAKENNRRSDRPDSLAERRYYTRRFTIVTAEGDEITGFQRTAEDLHHTDLIYMVQKSPKQPTQESIEQTINKLEKDIDNQ